MTACNVDITFFLPQHVCDPSTSPYLDLSQHVGLLECEPLHLTQQHVVVTLQLLGLSTAQHSTAQHDTARHGTAGRSRQSQQEEV